MAQTFRGWLREHIKEDSPIGDLARDTLSDKRWKGRTYNSLFDHLYDVHAPIWVLRTAHEADCYFRGVDPVPDWVKEDGYPEELYGL